MSMNFWQNSKGFSIVQGMILASILAGSALVGAKLIQDQKLTQKHAETRDLIETLNERVLATLQNKDNCLQTFGTHTGSNDLIDLTTIWSKMNQGGSETGRNAEFATSTSTTPVTYMNGSIIIKSMQARNLNSPVGQFFIEYSRLNKNPNTRTKEGYGARNIKKSFDLVMQKQISPPHAFEGCYAVNAIEGAEQTSISLGSEPDASAPCHATDDGCIRATSGTKQFSQKFCEDMQDHGLMKWEPTLNKCVFNMLCGEGRVFAGIDSNGNKKCRPIFTQLDMNQFFDATACNVQPNMTVKMVKVGTRVRLICTPPTP